MDDLSTFFGADRPDRPDLDVILSELDVLRSIYGDEAIRPWRPSEEGQPPVVNAAASSTVRYEVHLSLPSPHEDVSLGVLVSLPPTYPAESPPQMQLLSRYVGAFGVDSELFGSVLRTFVSANGVDFTPDTVCVFDGMESIMERCVKWYEDRLSAQTAGELLREDARERHTPLSHKIESPHDAEDSAETGDRSTNVPAVLPEGIEIFQAEPIIDRKSAFVGRACRISDPSQFWLI
ncbi:hypothetical protein EWM64_g8096 [Hericium alpestre]|uniref:RWD domain-containing protein n=1 Tax=Hericium alpestre TaxID=135208 RepID=A0A4Y9ZQZ7_9AGAM|nr:hypothetical protein EWM64_g8096 [Hericium alpestre]